MKVHPDLQYWGRLVITGGAVGLGAQLLAANASTLAENVIAFALYGVASTYFARALLFVLLR